MTIAAAQIIDAIAARVRTTPVGLATPYADKTFTARNWPLSDDMLPAIRVQVPSGQAEDIEPITMHYPALQRHTLPVVIEGVVRATSDIDDAMNALAEAVLAHLFADQAASTLGGLAKTMQATAIQREQGSGDEAAIGRIFITLTVTFCTESNDPSTII